MLHLREILISNEYIYAFKLAISLYKCLINTWFWLRNVIGNWLDRGKQTFFHKCAVYGRIGSLRL